MESNNETNFSIVIPTYREVINIPHLVSRLSHVNFANRKFEVLLIDDNSQDGSFELVKSLSNHYPWLKMIVRNQPRDLSQAILTGFKEAQYPIVVTMDADLSHPPELIPTMLSMLKPPIDMVVGSRYIKGGSTDPTWPVLRKIVSRLAAMMARFLLFARAKDPLSGFIAMHKQPVISAAPIIKPIGWKIGLEIMIKCRCKQIREIPIHFAQRRHGKSKLNVKISLKYLHHVARLMSYKLANANSR